MNDWKKKWLNRDLETAKKKMSADNFAIYSVLRRRSSRINCKVLDYEQIALDKYGAILHEDYIILSGFGRVYFVSDCYDYIGKINALKNRTNHFQTDLGFCEFIDFMKKDYLEEHKNRYCPSETVRRNVYLDWLYSKNYRALKRALNDLKVNKNEINYLFKNYERDTERCKERLIECETIINNILTRNEVAI